MSDYCEEFDRLRRNHVEVSFHKYGPAAKNFGEGRVDALETAQLCIDAFRKDHNTEHLVDRSIKSGVYRHFKGGYYCVLCMAVHTETGENLVIYQELYGERRVFARPIDMFQRLVDKGKYPDSKQQYRFEFVEVE